MYVYIYILCVCVCFVLRYVVGCEELFVVFGLPLHVMFSAVESIC